MCIKEKTFYSNLQCTGQESVPAVMHELQSIVGHPLHALERPTVSNVYTLMQL